MKLYRVGIENKSIGEFDSVYNTLNYSKAVEVLEHLKTYSTRYPKWDRTFTDKELKEYSKTIESLDTELSLLIGKKVHQLSYISSKDILCITSITIDDNLPFEEK